MTGQFANLNEKNFSLGLSLNRNPEMKFVRFLYSNYANLSLCKVILSHYDIAISFQKIHAFVS